MRVRSWNGESKPVFPCSATNFLLIQSPQIGLFFSLSAPVPYLWSGDNSTSLLHRDVVRTNAAQTVGLLDTVVTGSTDGRREMFHIKAFCFLSPVVDDGTDVNVASTEVMAWLVPCLSSEGFLAHSCVPTEALNVLLIVGVLGYRLCKPKSLVSLAVSFSAWPAHSYWTECVLLAPATQGISQTNSHPGRS